MTARTVQPLDAVPIGKWLSARKLGSICEGAGWIAAHYFSTLQWVMGHGQKTPWPMSR